MIYDGQLVAIYSDYSENTTALQGTSAADDSNGNLKHFSLGAAACCLFVP